MNKTCLSLPPIQIKHDLNFKNPNKYIDKTFNK